VVWGAAPQINEAAWKAAHSRLYDHLRRTTCEGSAPTLAELEPLYHAVAHGCRAGRYEEALAQVYVNRICRRGSDGHIEFYPVYKLGAVGSSLAAISWFFDRPYDVPAGALNPGNQAWVVVEASVGLRTQGRVQEALPAMRMGLQMEEAAEVWPNAQISASNLSETELLFGDITAAIASAERAVALAKRVGDAGWMMVNLITRAGALLAAGEQARAASLFLEAERQQQAGRSERKLLYSTAGHQYCDLLLASGRAEEAHERVVQTLQWARERLGLLPVALDNLTLGRAQLALALNSASELSSKSTVDATARLDEAVEGLRASEQTGDLPRGLLARAALRRAVGDWDGTKRDLDEAKEIAEPGLMRLYWCDCALEGARLALAWLEAFAPLNGLVEPSPPRPVLPDATAAAALREEARKELEVARKLIAECGYHRRDEELAELDAVVAGGRRFADLPPRV
jgi:tetratricopeptide (TPR) repeat protein